MIDPNAPAYPSSEGRGLTIHQAFVLAAMQGLCADPTYQGRGSDDLAQDAVIIADATIEALDKEEA